MTSLGSQFSYIEYNKRLKLLKPKRLKKRAKAVTIGIGFQCVDGVVLCADQQITFPQSHKYHECKIFKHSGKGWNVAFSYAGDPNLMKAINDKFPVAVADIKPPIDTTKLRSVIEGLLLPMDMTDFADGFNMLCAVQAAQQCLLLKTANRSVRGLDADRFWTYVGFGDSSVLRCFGSLLAHSESGTCTVDQAYALGIYLVAQAKRYVADCGGDTDTIILRSTGEVDQRGVSSTHNVEQQLVILEYHISAVAGAFFDRRIDDKRFGKMLDDICKKLREERQPYNIWPSLP